MDRKSRAPQFGNWENGENPLYTAYFDQVRQNRHGGKVVNPNVPEENPDAFVKISSSNQSVAPSKNPKPEQAIGQGVVRHTHARRESKEDRNLRPQMNNYPSPAPEYRGRRLDQNSTEPRNADRVVGPGGYPKRKVWGSVGSEHSIEQTPLHQPNQVRPAGRGSESAPSWGRNGSTDGGRGAPARSEHSIEQSPLHQPNQVRPAGRGSESAPTWGRNGSTDGGRGAPARSPMRPNHRAQGSGGRGASVPVPRFGDWDVNSTASSNGYTLIFDKVREEKQTVQVKTPENKINQSPYTNERRTNTSHKNYKSKKNSCFPWCGFF